MLPPCVCLAGGDGGLEDGWVGERVRVRPIMAPEGVALVNRVDVWCNLEALRLVLTCLQQHEPISMQITR